MSSRGPRVIGGIDMKKFLIVALLGAFAMPASADHMMYDLSPKGPFSSRGECEAAAQDTHAGLGHYNKDWAPECVNVVMAPGEPEWYLYWYSRTRW